MNTIAQKVETKEEVKIVPQNVLATILFKHSTPTVGALLSSDTIDTTISKNIVFLEAKSSKHIFYRICDYMYSKGYTGFEIKDFKILEDGVTVDADLIISVQNGKMLSFNKK